VTKERGARSEQDLDLFREAVRDVVPIKPFARAVCMIEQLGGLAYVAVLVSRLVGLTVRGPRAS
jgi:hypothetical protein